MNIHYISQDNVGSLFIKSKSIQCSPRFSDTIFHKIFTTMVIDSVYISAIFDLRSRNSGDVKDVL